MLKYDKEVRDINTLIQRERERAQKNTALISEHEERLHALDQQESGLRSLLGKAQERLAAAEKEVQRITHECESLTSSREGALSRLSALRNDNLRVQEALTLGEKSLQAAQKKAEQVRVSPARRAHTRVFPHTCRHQIAPPQRRQHRCSSTDCPRAISQYIRLRRQGCCAAAASLLVANAICWPNVCVCACLCLCLCVCRLAHC